MSKCELFKSIASDVWDNISRNHNRGNRLNEEGITRDTVIGSIQNYVEDRHSFEVFAQKAKDEVNTGADIELYIQTSFNRFFRILIQAKIMEIDCTFVSLDRESGSTGRKQYETLNKYSKLVDAKSYYLFFNGIYGYQFSSSDCAGEYNEKQYGCAILDTNIVEKHCENNNTGIMGDSYNKHPIGIPWRKLTCCMEKKYNNLREYSIDEIDMDSHFERLFTEPPPIGYIPSGNFPRQSSISLANSKIHKLGWKPFARVFLANNNYKMRKRKGLLMII